MDIKKLKNEIRQEVIAELMPVYQSAIQDLDVERRFISEKEKIFDLCLKNFIDIIAIKNAKRKAEEELKQYESESGSATISE